MGTLIVDIIKDITNIKIDFFNFVHFCQCLPRNIYVLNLYRKSIKNKKLFTHFNKRLKNNKQNINLKVNK